MEMKVLIIENDSDIAEALTDLLEVEGHHPYHYESGAQALSGSMHQDSPDIILCDLTMPGMTGIEFRNQVLLHPKLRLIPFILMSARPFSKEEALQLNIQGFLRKPFSVEDILQLLKDYQKKN